jgi:hypothetical protein
MLEFDIMAHDLVIHKSHSKNDMLRLIKELSIDVGHSIDILVQRNKAQLGKVLAEWVTLRGTFRNPRNYMCLHTKSDLITHLTEPNPKKVLTVRQKQEIMAMCKKINKFSDNHYSLKATEFGSKEEVYAMADHVARHGDIPSCRKCIAKLMGDCNKIRKIEPTLSKIVKHELDQKKKVKTNYYTSLTIKQGRFVIAFG